MDQFIRPDAFANPSGLHSRFSAAAPFPHLIIDDFLLSDFAERLHDEVRQTSPNVDASNSITQKQKIACTDWSQFRKCTYRLIAFLNSAEFIRPLETITGIDGLLVDPWLEGGGIHLTSRGGFLKMHTDFNWNAKLRADRRINILLYLNKDWRPEWGGELLLAHDERPEERASIQPCFNRLVIFNTNDTTLHGHPHPLAFPDDYPRASIAMYYYSTGLVIPERRRAKATTTRYVPMSRNDIDLGQGSMRARAGYLWRRFTRF